MDEATCESPARRVSRRIRGEEPTSLSKSNIDSPCRELKMSVRTGECGGKLYNDSTDWEIFPDDDDDYSLNEDNSPQDNIAFR